MGSAEQMLEAIGRWAEDAAAREDEEALLAGLQRILVALLERRLVGPEEAGVLAAEGSSPTGVR